jgi:general secretion pathway protein F
MGMFRFTALTAAGKRVSGEVVGQSSAAVIERLQADGYYPMRADPVSRENSRWFDRELHIGRRISFRDLGIMCHELCTLLRAGLPLDQALATVADLSESKELRRTLSQVVERVRSGSTLADALGATENRLPPTCLSMIRAGQLGGSLEETLSRVSEYLGKNQDLRDSVRSAMIYPAVLLVVAGSSLIMMLMVVLPEFKHLFEDARANLPAATKIVIGLSDGLRANWPLLIVATAAIGLGWKFMARSEHVVNQIHKRILKIPLIGSLIAKIETARFSRTLGSLLTNGVTLPAGLQIAAESLGNRAMRAAILQLQEDVRKGDGFAAPLARATVFPKLFVHLVRVGEATGRLDEMLMRLADIFDREVQRTVERLLALLVPIVTIGLGFLVAGIIGSVLVAILSVNELAF